MKSTGGWNGASKRLGVSLAAVLFVTAAWSGDAAWGQCTTLSVGTNVDTSTRAGNESESGIAIDPTNTNRLFYLSNTDVGNFLRGGYSTNGGATWAKRDMATGADGLPAACCDGSASWDSFGNLFICYIAGSSAIVGLSTNGGQSFSQAASLTVTDQPTLVIGPGSVWVTFVDSASRINARGAAVSGLGAVGAFGAAQSVAGANGTGNYGDIAVGPSGQVMVTYQSDTGGQGPNSIFVALDADGLAAGGFAAPILATATNVGGFDFIPAQSTRSVDAESGLAWDRTGGARNGRVYLVYTNESPDESNNMDIYVRFSDNNGTSWSAAVKVNDDTTTNSQFNPRIALDQTTGNIAVSWYDCRNDNGTIGGGFTDTTLNNEAQFYGTLSTDGGATFLPNVRISAGVSKASTALNGIDFGDYTALAFHANKFFPLWADNSGVPSGNPNLPKLDLVTAAVTVSASSVGTPTSPLANPSTICAGGSSALSATVNAGETVDWFTVSCGGTAVPGGATPTVTPAGTTTYFARARNTTSGCVSAACASVSVTVNALPAAPTSPLATPSRICPGQPVTLSATVGGGQTVDWFTVSCGGTAVPGGANPTVTPAVTTTYYARARNASGCVSSTCASVTVVNAAHTGDFDGGGVGASDLPTFVAILLSPGTPQDCIADMNNDGHADGQDIQPWVNLLLP